MDDPQDFIDKTLAELDDYYATDEEDTDESESDGEEQSVETRHESEEELGEEAGEGDARSGEHGDGEGSGEDENQVTLPNGSVVSLVEIQRLAEFESFLNTHPDVAARVVDAARTSPSSSPEPPAPEQLSTTPPPLPEFLDTDDPATKWFVEQLTTLRTEHQRLQAEEAQRRIQTANYAAEQALLNVKDRLDLNDGDVVRLRDYTASLNIVPGIMSRHADNQVAGFTEALEIAAYSLPEFRDKIIAKQVETRTKTVKADNTRRSKLSKLSNKSGGGGAPPVNRKAVKDMTEDERREAMIQEFAESMGVPR